MEEIYRKFFIEHQDLIKKSLYPELWDQLYNWIANNGANMDPDYVYELLRKAKIDESSYIKNASRCREKLQNWVYERVVNFLRKWKSTAKFVSLSDLTEFYKTLMMKDTVYQYEINALDDVLDWINA